MAKRRQISPEIITSKEYLEFSFSHPSAAVLYTFLIAKADDDGIVDVEREYKIENFVYIAPLAKTDLQRLADAGYIYIFHTGAVVIRHWFVHNYIADSRKKKSDSYFQYELQFLSVDENGIYQRTFPNSDVNTDMNSNMNSTLYTDLNTSLNTSLNTELNTDLNKSNNQEDTAFSSCRNSIPNSNKYVENDVENHFEENRESSKENKEECLCIFNNIINTPLTTEKEINNTNIHLEDIRGVGEEGTENNSLTTNSKKKKRGRPAKDHYGLNDEEWEMFCRLWEVYPKKDSKKTAALALRKLHPTEELIEKILSAIEWQSKQEKWLKDNGQYVPMLSTYLNQERFNDEPPNEQKHMFTGNDTEPKRKYTQEEIDRAFERERLKNEQRMREFREGMSNA